MSRKTNNEIEFYSEIPFSFINSNSSKLGSSNLAQLNTSPWPTTGSSPVQSTSNLNWPPNVSSNLNAGGDSFSTQLNAKPFSGSSSTQENTNFADFGNVSTIPNSQPATTKPSFGSFPDPFGAAPNSNLHQQSGKQKVSLSPWQI